MLVDAQIRNETRFVGQLSLFSHAPTATVKSLRAVPVDKATLDDRGFVGDRRLMLVTPAPLPLYGKFLETDPTHRFLSQRQCPSLARVKATLLDNTTVQLAYQSRTLIVNLQDSSSEQPWRASLWDDVVQVCDLGDEAAEFLSAVVDDELPDEQRGSVRLVLQAPSDGRRAKDKYVPPSARTFGGPKVGLADGFPLLLANEASLEALNRKLEQKGTNAIAMNRFRPNIVVRGAPAFDEDYWRVIEVDGVILHIVKGCPRCKESCTDQETGRVYDEPVATLKEFRALRSDAPDDVFFAQNVALGVGTVGKTLRVGAKVRVLERGPPIWHR